MDDHRSYGVVSHFTMVVTFKSVRNCGGGYHSCGDDKDIQIGDLIGSFVYPVIHTATELLG